MEAAIDCAQVGTMGSYANFFVKKKKNTFFSIRQGSGGSFETSNRFKFKNRKLEFQNISIQNVCIYERTLADASATVVELSVAVEVLSTTL
jgi:hypothetical protein